MNDIKIIESTLTDVVVFLDGARVTRTGEAKLKKGINELKLEKISKYLDSNSVRVKGSGKNIKAKLIDVETNHNYKEITGHIEIDKLRKKLKTMEKEKNALIEDKENLINNKKNLTQIFENFTIEFPKFFAAGESSIENLKSLQDYSDQSKMEVQKKIRDLDSKLEDLSTKILETQKELQKLGGGQTQIEENYDIIISIESDGDGIFDYSIMYQIQNAFWVPFYDILITEEKTSMNYMANIINKTLEDWDGVNLEISTATFKPVRITDPEPWYISVYQPYARTSSMGTSLMDKKMKGIKRDFAPASPAPREKEVSMDELLEEEEEEPIITDMEVESAKFSETTFGVQKFTISKKMSIAADENPHPVMLQEFEVNSSRLFYWNSIDQQLIAQEKIRNGELTLLPGTVKCYVDGDFVGETNIKAISPSEEFKLGTRLSFEMKVDKKLVKRDVDKKGITKGKRENDYEYEIKINNYRKEASRITIIDRIPHSASADIEVEPDEKHLEEYFFPKPNKFKLNIATWDLELKPEEELKIKYKYAVKYGKDTTITPSLP
ncbi:MAG: mucoidy inhibitor MuiA family protein [Candidatus Lokiarchaeota archaeon]|nr:mucoidy inhibitor MuiA family protein [Candidatus Lokiarchaeota archaeon]